MNKTPDTIKHLIIINIIVFIVTKIKPDIMFNLFSLYFPLNDKFHSWQFFSNMFMHANEIHLALNMYGLWLFGSLMIRIWGNKRFLFFYFLAGLGGSLLYLGVNYYFYSDGLNNLLSLGYHHDEIMHYINNNLMSNKNELNALTEIYNTPILGASGAIYGLLMAFTLYFPDAELMIIPIPIPVKAKYLMAFLIVVEVYIGLTNAIDTNIGHMAHMGGALVGFIMIKIWGKYKHERWD